MRQLYRPKCCFGVTVAAIWCLVKIMDLEKLMKVVVSLIIWSWFSHTMVYEGWSKCTFRLSAATLLCLGL